MIGIIIAKDKRADYIFKTFFDTLGYPYRIYNKKKDFLNQEHLIFIYYGQDKDFLKKIGKNKPVIFIPSDKKNITHSNKLDIVSFSSDIIKESFNILSREEESLGSFDEHKRFPARNSKIFKNLKHPPLNNYLSILEGIIKKICVKNKFPIIKKCAWPEGKEFAVCLTHDVDAVYKYNFIGSLVVLKNCIIYLFNFRLIKFAEELKGAVLHILNKKDPYWQFDNVMELESEYDFKSTFFFCPKKRHKLDPNYSVSDKDIKKMMRKISNRGFEIGLHSSYDSYNKKKLFFKEKKEIEDVIGKKVLGNRTHFLRFDVLDTWDTESKSGMIYDSSLGYSENIGFRNGFCFPYFPIDIKKNELRGILEIPLAVMDGALFSEISGQEKTWKKLNDFFNKIKQYNGLVTLNWHQRVFYEKDFPGWGCAYKKSLEYFKRNNAYAANGFEVADWWNKRNSVNLINAIVKPNYLQYDFKSDSEIENLCFEILKVKNTTIEVTGNKNYEIIKKGKILIKFAKISPQEKIKIKIIKNG